MDNSHDFSDFSRQSAKGIIIIYVDLLVKFFRASWVLFFLFFRKISSFSSVQLLYVYLGLASIFIFFLVRSYLLYSNFLFKVTKDHFILKRGIISKSNTTISFDRIQNINFKQNLIKQIINVYGVTIETAGSSKTEIKIKALSFENAMALKDSLSVQKNVVEVEENVEKETALLTISFKELFKVSLTENHFQSLLLFVALLVGLFQQVEQLIKGIDEKDYLEEYLNQGTDVLLGNVLLIFILVFFLFIVAIITSFIRVFLFHFNLTVFVKKDAFEINQGLFTKKSIVLKKQKIQSITVSTNPIKKWIGISYITFKQAVSGKINQKKDKLIRIVGCKNDEVLKVKNHLYTTLEIDKEEPEKLDVYYKYRMFFQSFLFLIAVNFFLYLVYNDVVIFSLNILMIPLFYGIIILKYKKRFYKVVDDLLVVGQGVVDTHHTYFEIFKIQNVKMKQTIFQHRKNVADIVIQTASGKIRIPCLQLSRASELYNYFLYKVESNQNSWM